MKTKIDIISGFLGSGKTTLIKKFITEKLYTEKLVIIENEFGEVGIDGSLLKEYSLEIKEINSGCICCTLAGDFEKAIAEVVSTFKPDRILIEPSGVGKLSDVVKACETPKLKDIVIVNILITVVDVERFKLYISNFSEFYKNQIEYAKTIILSRTQNTDVQKIQTVVNEIRSINNKAKIITTPWDSMSSEKITSVAGQKESTLLLEQELAESHYVQHGEHACHEGCKCKEHDHSHSHSANEVFDVWGAETPRIFSEKEIRDILVSLENTNLYGMVLRAKGILQVEEDKWIKFDYVTGESKINESDADYTGKLAVIGKELNKKKLNELFAVI